MKIARASVLSLVLLIVRERTAFRYENPTTTLPEFSLPWSRVLDDDGVAKWGLHIRLVEVAEDVLPKSGAPVMVHWFAVEGTPQDGGE